MGVWRESGCFRNRKSRLFAGAEEDGGLNLYTYCENATIDAEREGKFAKKGQLLKAASPNARYVINARNIGVLLDELLTDPTIKKIRGQRLRRLLKKQNASENKMAKLFLPMMGTQG